MKKKWLIAGLALASALTASVGLAACGHTHDFSGEWKDDENYHWHECAEDGEIDEKEAHVDENSDGVCDVCGREGLSSGDDGSGSGDDGSGSGDDGSGSGDDGNEEEPEPVVQNKTVPYSYLPAWGSTLDFYELSPGETITLTGTISYKSADVYAGVVAQIIPVGGDECWYFLRPDCPASYGNEWTFWDTARFTWDVSQFVEASYNAVTAGSVEITVALSAEGKLTYTLHFTGTAEEGEEPYEYTNVYSVTNTMESATVGFAQDAASTYNVTLSVPKLIETAAAPLTSDDSYNGTTYFSTDTAKYSDNTVYYTFTPEESGIYTVSTSEYYSYGYTAYVTVKNGDTVVAQTLKEDDTTDISVNVTLTEGTAYTVIVAPYKPADNTYASAVICVAQGSSTSSPYYVYGYKATETLTLFSGTAYCTTDYDAVIVTSISEGATLTVGEDSYTSGTLPDGGVQIAGYTAFTVTSSTLTEVTLGTEIYYAPGTENNPYVLSSSDLPSTTEASAYTGTVTLGVRDYGYAEPTYYTVTASGQYKISTSASGSGVNIVVDWSPTSLGSEGYTFNVPVGASFSFSLELDDSNSDGTLTAKEITFTIAYVGEALATPVYVGETSFSEYSSQILGTTEQEFKFTAETAGEYTFYLVELSGYGSWDDDTYQWNSLTDTSNLVFKVDSTAVTQTGTTDGSKTLYYYDDKPMLYTTLTLTADQTVSIKLAVNSLTSNGNTLSLSQSLIIAKAEDHEGTEITVGSTFVQTALKNGDDAAAYWFTGSANTEYTVTLDGNSLDASDWQVQVNGGTAETLTSLTFTVTTDADGIGTFSVAYIGSVTDGCAFTVTVSAQDSQS